MSPGRRVEVESSGIIDAPLEKLWDLVSDFSNLARWHPDVTECRLESGSARQAGAVRSVRLRNGISIRRPHGDARATQLDAYLLQVRQVSLPYLGIALRAAS